jgi:uncharacterized protein YecE (DUF72 family)
MSKMQGPNPKNGEFPVFRTVAGLFTMQTGLIRQSDRQDAQKEETAMGRLKIGTSGWHYEHWRGPFYPEHMDAGQMLSHYCRSFTTVEINNSFYRLPSENTLSDWRRTVPRTFCFSVKASRYITHMKKLKDFHQPLQTFLDRVALLGDRLGPVLFQLPPRWKFNPERLQKFVAGLPDGFRFVFEFRDPSWYHRRAFDILAERGVGFCMHDMSGSVSPKALTAEFLYVRFHGPQKYGGSYSAQTLSGWAGAFSTWKRQGKEIFAYFNNDARGHAVRNALALKRMLES